MIWIKDLLSLKLKWVVSNDSDKGSLNWVVSNESEKEQLSVTSQKSQWEMSVTSEPEHHR